MADPAPLEAPPVESPIFLVGTMRSGTTLLRLILDSHEHLALADESGFLRAVAAARAIPDFHDGPGWYRRFGRSDEEMDARLRAFYDELFSDWARSRGARRWGDKTPFHIAHLRLLAEVFPDAQVVGIVRHPGAVVASQLRRGIPFPDALRHWRNQNVRLLQGAQRKDLRRRLVVLRYEDLVAGPEPLLRELVEFLGEPWSPDLLRHHELAAEQGGRRLAEGGTRPSDPIDAGRGAGWQRELTAPQRRELLQVTAALRGVFRYDDAGALPLRGEGEGEGDGEGGLLLRGRDLVARRRSGGPEVLDRTPIAGSGQSEPQTVATLLRMTRTDPVYVARRLPVVVRARLHRRAAHPD